MIVEVKGGRGKEGWDGREEGSCFVSLESWKLLKGEETLAKHTPLGNHYPHNLS